MPDLPPQYNPADVEERLYESWAAAGLFEANANSTRTPYTIVIPPPNVTGILHMGHALNTTLQDILIRWKRMQGANALWVPGTDHAGIATQNVVEKALAKEGTTRQDLGRDEFLKRVWAWKEEYGSTILRQLRRLGASCDWRRARFTMDEGLSEAVLEVFVRLYEKGLIYRGNYIINWCPRCQTALSDEEAPRQETQGKLYHIRYPLEGKGKPSHIEVATTRPETMLGDTAVAVHPKDPRYKQVVGRNAILPLVGRKLPIFSDPAVDKEFGTGAVKVTPAHDPVDFQLGRKHRLEFINVMTDDAHMTNVPKAYEGLDRFECRSKLIVDLEREGLLGRIDEHLHNVGHCYRCHTAVEPRLSLQWFVKMKPLALPAIQAVKKKQIVFIPDRWTKVYLNWMEHIEDWCISRQIWWGHRLPVYYCRTCQAKGKGRGKAAKEPGVIVSKTKPATCPVCKGTDLTQDEDVLDTWFSSWLWPSSTLGWPKQTRDLAAFYPTNTLVTAQEIIFFWVARMIMAGYFCMGKPPFHQVYIHGTVRDLTGKKMSKSLGNIIDPLDIIEKYGTDALRYTLVTTTAVGQDVFLSEERFAAGRNFANKLWNATRFVLAQHAGAGPSAALPDRDTLSPVDRWILSRFERTITAATEALDDFRFNEAASTVYDFLWHDYCDWYLEASKVALAHEPQRKPQILAVLVHVLDTSLRLLHPTMPFVTETLWQHLQGEGAKRWIMTAHWPLADRTLTDTRSENLVEALQAVVTAARTLRAEFNVPAGTKPPLRLIVPHPEIREFLEAQRPLLQTLAQAGEVAIERSRTTRPKQTAVSVTAEAEVLLPLEGLIDPAKERQRLQQRVDQLSQELSRLHARLKDRQFTAKAPADVVDQMRGRQEEVEAARKRFTEHLAVLEA